jgi:septicolysin
MKLAEALILRADLQKRIDQLRVRLNNNAKVQENDEPSEKPEELLNELDSNINQLKILIKQINKTNSVTVSNGQTLADLIAERDTLTLKSNILRGFLNIAGQKVNLYSTTEIKIMSTVDVPALQKELDLLSKKIRETDTELQQANWLTELIEN